MASVQPIPAAASGCDVFGQILERPGGWTTVKAPVFPPTAATLAGPAAITGFALDQRSPQTMYVTNNQSVMASFDGGCRWSAVLHLPTEGPALGILWSSDLRIQSLSASSSAAGSAVYVAINGTQAIFDSGDSRFYLLVSTDRGQTWVRRDEGLPPVGAGPVVHASSADPRTAYLRVMLNRLAGYTIPLLQFYVTSDAGATWQRVAGDVPSGGDVPRASFESDPAAPREIWRWSPLARSTNAGASWSDVSNSIQTLAGTTGVTGAAVGRWGTKSLIAVTPSIVSDAAVATAVTGPCRPAAGKSSTHHCLLTSTDLGATWIGTRLPEDTRSSIRRTAALAESSVVVTKLTIPGTGTISPSLFDRSTPTYEAQFLRLDRTRGTWSDITPQHVASYATVTLSGFAVDYSSDPRMYLSTNSSIEIYDPTG